MTEETQNQLSYGSRRWLVFFFGYALGLALLAALFIKQLPEYDVQIIDAAGFLFAGTVGLSAGLTYGRAGYSQKSRSTLWVGLAGFMIGALQPPVSDLLKGRTPDWRLPLGTVAAGFSGFAIGLLISKWRARLGAGRQE
jgi:ABC-type branched-subunit amino acid transport system permease subunit